MGDSTQDPVLFLHDINARYCCTYIINIPQGHQEPDSGKFPKAIYPYLAGAEITFVYRSQMCSSNEQQRKHQCGCFLPASSADLGGSDEFIPLLNHGQGALALTQKSHYSSLLLVNQTKPNRSGDLFLLFDSASQST